MALWTPANITTALWLDAADASTITLDSGKVSQWDDKSGGGRHAIQADAALQGSTTTINGVTAVLFNDDAMSLNEEVPTVSAAFFVTDNALGSNVAANLTPLFASGTIGEHYTFIATNTTSYSLSIDGAGGAYGPGNASANGGALVAGGDIDLGLSNAEKAGQVIWYIDWSLVQQAKEIGHYKTSGARYTRCVFGEIVLLDFVPDTATRQRLVGYFAHRWGMEGNLPADHPYKLAAPVYFSISGTVTNAAGGPAARTLRAYSRATGALVGETVSDVTTGEWEITLVDPGEVTVLALADEVQVYVDLAHRVIPA